MLQSIFSSYVKFLPLYLKRLQIDNIPLEPTITGAGHATLPSSYTPVKYRVSIKSQCSIFPFISQIFTHPLSIVALRAQVQGILHCDQKALIWKPNDLKDLWPFTYGLEYLVSSVWLYWDASPTYARFVQPAELSWTFHSPFFFFFFNKTKLFACSSDILNFWRFFLNSHFQFKKDAA